MATAYKYVERKAEDNINWAEVGSNVNNMLNEEMRVRTEKKSAIDAASREYQKVLNSVPQGENSELNKFALGFSDDLQKQMLMQETLLKSGQLSPSQYTMMRQNLTDGTDQGFNLLQDYNNEYEAKMSLLGDDVAYGDQLSGIDLQIMANVEGFSNFSNSKLVINPESGLVSMGKMIINPDDPDGPRILDPNRNNLVSVQNLRNRIKTKITKYDVVGNAEQFESTLGKDVRQTIDSMGTKYTAGTLKKIEDIKQREGGFKDMDPARIAEIALEMGVEPSDIQALSLFDEAAANWAQSQLQGGSYNAASTLMDFSKFTLDGLQYTTTFDEADTLDENGKRKQNVILLQSENGRTVTKMTDEQNSAAERVIISQLGVQLDYEETVDVKKIKYDNTVNNRARTDTENKRGDLLKKQDNVYSNVAKLYYGTNAEVDEAIKFLRSTNPDITDIDRDGKDVILRYADGKTETLPFSSASGGQLNQQSWVDGSANFFLSDDDKIANINEVGKRSKVDLTKELNVSSLGYGGEEIQVKEGLEAAFIAKISEGQPAPSAILVMNGEDESMQNLQSVISSLPGLTGFTVEEGGTNPLTDELIINNAANKEVARINLDKSTYGTTDKYNKAMAKFMESVYAMSSNATTAENKVIKVGKLKGTSSRRGTLRNITNNNVTTTTDSGGGVNGGEYNKK